MSYLSMVTPDRFICPHCHREHVLFYAEATAIYGADFVQRVDAIVAWLIANEIETNPPRARDLAIMSATMTVNHEQESAQIKARTTQAVEISSVNNYQDIGGFVYFVRVPGGDRVKIGFSANVKKRLGALSTHMGQPLDVLLVIPGTRNTEQNQHALWSYARKRGEWFEIDDELEMWINLMVKATGFKPYRIG